MPKNTLDVITPEQAGTLPGAFRERVKRTPNDIAYRFYSEDSQSWRDITWREAGKSVARIQAALAKESLYPGDRVAMMLRNCPQWVFFEQAAMGLGLIVVPLYTNDRTENISYVLQDAGVKVLLIEDVIQLQTLDDIASQIDGLVRLLSIKACKSYNRFTRLMTMDEWLEPVADTVDESQLYAKEGISDDLATIVYTSGTTGRPKGVMLSHWNILTNAYAGGFKAFTAYKEDVFLSFLPLSHMLERTVGYYIPIMGGCTVAFARSVQDLAEDLLSIKPTVLISVPRIYERIFNKITLQLEQKPAFARNLYHKAVEVGWDRFNNPQRPHFAWPLLKALVANKINSKLGGRLRLAICGGAPLAPSVAKTFIGLGVRIFQGYGLTETSPIISANTENNNIPESVGTPLDGVEIKIGDNDELLVRGPLVMMGYWHNNEATEEIIDKDGWLHTGDQVRLEDQQRIYITGRLKEIIVLSNGEKVPPNDMELAISIDPIFDQVIVVGEGRPYLSAITVLNPDQLQNLCSTMNLDANAADILQNETLLNTIHQRICEKIKSFPGYAQIQTICCTLQPWTIESGLVTPTLKLRRQRIMQHHAADIEQLYLGHGSPEDFHAPRSKQTA